MVIWHGLLFTASVTGTDEATCRGHGECSDAVRGNNWESATEDECSTGCTGIHRRQHQSQTLTDPETVTLHFPREICTGHHHPSKTSFEKSCMHYVRGNFAYCLVYVLCTDVYWFVFHGISLFYKGSWEIQESNISTQLPSTEAPIKVKVVWALSQPLVPWERQ